MPLKKISIGLSLLLLLLSKQILAQKAEALPRSNPEAEGVSSEGIIRFLDSAGKSKHEFHSFMFLRHGKVIAEGWWTPYHKDLKHTMYSVSKSFTSTAVGFAVSENRMTVNDKVISFFPDQLPDSISQYLAELTVKDVLSMAVGHSQDHTRAVINRDTNWVKSFLAAPIVYKPGTAFLYNSLGSYTLSAIVQKVTGEKSIDYLKPRLFKPLGIVGMDWEIDPNGINTGGWGLRIKTEDMAKFGQLFLQKGKWNGTQILPEDWIEEATTIKIDQAPRLSQSAKDSSDWLQGYCYQFWRSRHNSYRADGAFGQFIVVIPEKDAVIVITAETTNMQDELNLVWKYLLPAMKKDKLPPNKSMAATLRRKLSSLSLPLPAKNVTASIGRNNSRKNFSITTTEGHRDTMSFQFKDNICDVTVRTDTAIHRLQFGLGTWKTGETTKRGPYLLPNAKANRVGLPPFKVAGSYSWKDENTLELVLRYIESPHRETITCDFDNEKISIDIRNSADPGNRKTILKGELVSAGNK